MIGWMSVSMVTIMILTLLFAVQASVVFDIKGIGALSLLGETCIDRDTGISLTLRFYKT